MVRTVTPPASEAAAGRLLIAGPSLFYRDHRPVARTPAGAALLPHARALLDGADDLRRRAARMAGSAPVRLGWVSRLPPDLTARASAAAHVHVDPWGAPPHTQAARAAEGSLDLIGADRLYAVSAGQEEINAIKPGYLATDMNRGRGPGTVAGGATVVAEFATLGDEGPTGEFHNDRGPAP